MEVDEEALTWIDDPQPGDKIGQDGVKEEDGKGLKEHKNPKNLKDTVDEDVLASMNDSEDKDKAHQGSYYEEGDEGVVDEGSKGHNMSNEAAAADDDDEKEFKENALDADHAIITLEAGTDEVVPPSINAVTFGIDNDDNDKDDYDGSRNRNSRIINLEDELGISDGLGKTGMLIETNSDGEKNAGNTATTLKSSTASGQVLGHPPIFSSNSSSHVSNAATKISGSVQISNRALNRNNPSSNQTYPQDTYSFLALNGPENNWKWVKNKSLFFLFGLLPFLFQMVFLGLLFFSKTNELRGTIGETDNPDGEKEGTMALLASFIPANSTPTIRCAQVTSIAAFVFFPDASLQDIMKSIRLFPRSKTRGSDVLSCLFRLIQGLAAMVVTVLLVLTSNTVVDIILNFTAVNFISGLDEYAFSLAISGEFSPKFQAEAERIAKTDLPRCMTRGKESKWRFNLVIMVLVAMILSAMMIFVYIAQDSPKYWVTGTLRVQIQDTELNQFSGCFQINTEPNSMYFSRRTYHSIETGSTNYNTSFGYCREDRRWVLFKNNTLDPCVASNSSDTTLALSSKTDSYDISTIFDQPWVSSSNTPLDLYFFDGASENEIIENCGSVLGDGICDTAFNEAGFQYDGGDCCASTCTQFNCGIGGLSSAFNVSNVSGDGFEHCVDPEMYAITLHLNNVTSSRDAKYTGVRNWWELGFNSENEYERWAEVAPVSPYFALDCDGKNVMTAYIEDTMVNKSQTVMVQDGASCTLVGRNSTTDINIITDDPIWLIDYTVFHERVNGNEGERVEILTSNSAQVETVDFKRMPECYFRKLRYHTDLGSIYTYPADSYSNEAIRWLLRDNAGSSSCEDSTFLERYALVSMSFAVTKNESTYIERGKQCSWLSVICGSGNVNEIKMKDAGLEGPIPSELGLLSSLDALQLSCDQIESLKQIHPKGLKKLDMSSSKSACTKLPKDLSDMVQLENIDLRGNALTELPSSIDNLSSLQTLYLGSNALTDLPSSIGNLSSLQTLDLYYNVLTVLPSSIGNLSSLQTLYLNYNGLTVLPSSIGKLSSLKTLYLTGNGLTVLPSSIGNLSSLQTLSLYGNPLNCTEELEVLCESIECWGLYDIC